MFERQGQTAERKECSAKIIACIKQVDQENRKIAEHNRALRTCEIQNDAALGTNERPPCQGSDLAAAKAATAQAKKALDTTISALRNPNADQLALMEKWFGVRNSAEAATLSANLNKMRAFIDTATFLCPPKSEEAYAYVRPDKSFAIVLSSFFFTAPDAGLSSKPGVLVHEMSHFLLSGGTDDPAPEKYGPDAAQNLAKSDPNAARRNAENYEYFVEELAGK